MSWHIVSYLWLAVVSAHALTNNLSPSERIRYVDLVTCINVCFQSEGSPLEEVELASCLDLSRPSKSHESEVMERPGQAKKKKKERRNSMGKGR